MEYKVLDYKIHLSNNVLDVLSKNRQITNSNFEIGGQLFGYKIDKDFFISDATVSNKVDKKSSISRNLRLTSYDIYYRIIVNKRN